MRKNSSNKIDVKVVFLDQSAGEIVHEFADRSAIEIGKTVIITGAKFRKSKDNLTVIKAPKYNNKSYISRFRTWSSYFIYAFFFLIRIEGNPVLVISSNPPFLPLIGFFYKKIRGWKYIVRILDVWPDAMVQIGLVRQTNPIYKMWGWLNRIMFRHAKHTVTVAHFMAEKASQYIDSSSKVGVIPNWVNVEQYKPIPKSNNWFAKEHFDLINLTVIYSGNLGLTHDVTTLFEGMRFLQEQKDISFAIIGGGARQKEVVAQSKLLTNLKYLPYQPEDALPFSIASADIAIVVLGQGTEGISMPSKLYFSMAAGCAIISISDGNNDLKYIIENQNCGINIENGDIEGFVNAVMRFKNNELFLNNCKENSREAALKYYSSEVVIPKYLNMIIDMLNNKKH